MPCVCRSQLGGAGVAGPSGRAGQGPAAAAGGTLVQHAAQLGGVRRGQHERVRDLFCVLLGAQHLGPVPLGLETRHQVALSHKVDLTDRV